MAATAAEQIGRGEPLTSNIGAVVQPTLKARFDEIARLNSRSTSAELRRLMRLHVAAESNKA